MAGILARLAHAWNAFKWRDESNDKIVSFGSGTAYSRPDRPRLRFTTERSIIAGIYTRLSIDVAQVDLRHIRLDENDRFLEEIDSGLNECLKVEANIDQASRDFVQDIALTLFDKGHAAIVPVESTINPSISGSFDIKVLRVGEIVGWMPKHVQLLLYNEDSGNRELITLEKKFVAVVYNPLYAVMNEPNSTLQRLIAKLHLLDAVDEQSSSGRLDVIIQLPYVIKSDMRREQARQRREDLEEQLRGSKYGVGYIDGTEKVVQLNRPAENNLLKQVEYLTNMLYGQLGLTEEVMNGTADEKAMINYGNRTILPLVEAIVQAMRRSFLTKTARSQRQTVAYFRDPFKLIPLSDLAEVVDKFTRNEVMSANEIRGAMGIKPSKDPKADELHNSNMPEPPPAPAPISDSQEPIRVGAATVSRRQITSAPSESSNNKQS